LFSVLAFLQVLSLVESGGSLSYKIDHSRREAFSALGQED
jgi:hypothetical protein